MPYRLESYHWKDHGSDIEQSLHYVKYYETKPTTYIAVATVEIDPTAHVLIALQVEKAPFKATHSPHRSGPPYDKNGEFVVRRVCDTEAEAINLAMEMVTEIAENE